MKPLKRISWAIVCAIALTIIGAGSIGAAPPEGKGKPSKEVTSVQLAETGQTTSFRTGDDGDLRAGVTSPDPRFTDNGNGTVTDNLTGLTWPIQFGFYNPDAPYWWIAIDYCNADDLGGFDDWRLPNLKELMSLLDFEQRGLPNEPQPLLPLGHPFVNVPPSFLSELQVAPSYWASTTAPAPDFQNYAYKIDVYRGLISSPPKSSGGYTICVRGGT